LETVRLFPLCYNVNIISSRENNMATSITVVQADGTIWTTGEFTQITPPETEDFVPTEAQVQAAVDAGVIAAFTRTTPAA
jgi:hypothetical protein